MSEIQKIPVYLVDGEFAGMTKWQLFEYLEEQIREYDHIVITKDYVTLEEIKNQPEQ
jgi:hypothetical protein